jgi:hypothetical protein
MKIPWFFCLNENRDNLFLEMAKVAVASSVDCNFDRYCVYDGNNTEFESFLKDYKVTIIKHESFFKKDMLDFVDTNLHNTYFGAYLRIDIPKIIQNLNLEVDYYLYTDCDVIFQKDPREMLFSHLPKCISAAGEISRDKTTGGKMKHFNSGIMWCNAQSLAESYDSFSNFVKAEKFKFDACDQGALNAFYIAEKFEDELNWKPYWGINEEASIIHFHGPKPHHFNLWLNSQKKLTDPKIRNYGYFLNAENFKMYSHYVKMYNKVRREIL